MRFLCIVLAVAWSAASVSADPVHEAMQDYVDFSTYDAGIILPVQITQDIFENVTFIDTRNGDAFEAETIPGSANIEWREIFGRIDEVPTDHKVILFCDTGILSAQAAFGLRVLGRENVLVLQTGFAGWKETAAFRPNR